MSSRLPSGGLDLGLDATVTIRVDEILQQHRAAFLDANLAMENLAKREATLRKWDWPNDPSPRDVVDSGRLRSSIFARPDGDLTEWLHAVDVAYAIPVLLGYRLGTKTYPGRNIYDEPLRRLPRLFANAFTRRGGTV